MYMYWTTYNVDLLMVVDEVLRDHLRQMCPNCSIKGRVLAGFSSNQSRAQDSTNWLSED